MRGKRKLKASFRGRRRGKSFVASRSCQASVCLFQALGVEAEFLGHLDQLLGSFGILDGLRQAFGPVGLVSVMIGLGHGSTFQRISTGSLRKVRTGRAGLEFVFMGASAL